MPNELGLPEGTQAFRGADDTLDTRRLYDTDVEGRFLTLTEMEEWKKKIIELEETLVRAKAARLELYARAEKAESERDAAIKEVAKYAQATGKAEAALKETRAKIQEAFDYAAHRWSEWGSRAENVCEILESALTEKEG